MFCSRACHAGAAQKDDPALAARPERAPGIDLNSALPDGQDLNGIAPIEICFTEQACPASERCSRPPTQPAGRTAARSSEELNSPDCVLHVHRQNLRELLDEWGHKHTQLLMQALKNALHHGSDRLHVPEQGAMVATGSDPASSPGSASRPSTLAAPQSRVSTRSAEEEGHGPIVAMMRSHGDEVDRMTHWSSNRSRVSQARKTKKWLSRGFSSGVEEEDDGRSPTSSSAVFGGVSYTATSLTQATPQYPAEYHTQTTCTASGDAAAIEKTMGGSGEDRAKRPWESKRMQKMVFGPTGKSNFNSKKSRHNKSLARILADRIVNSTVFDVSCAIAIIANSALIGWRANYNMANIGRGMPPWASNLETCFAIFFTIEVVLKLMAFGVGFFRGPARKMNAFDFVLAVQGLLEAISLKENFLRLLRLIKMMRLLRVIRFLRRFREFRLLTTSLWGSVSAMVWSLSLLLGYTYLFGGLLLQASAHYLESGRATLMDEHLLRKYWGSLFTSMLTLFMASTAGIDWAEAAEPLMQVGLLVYVIFLLYVAVFFFSVTNAISALFVESMMRRAERDHVLTISRELEKKDHHVEKLTGLFQDCDSDQDGVISYDDFVACLNDPRLHAFASSLGIDTYDTVAFFKTLTGNLGDLIGVEAFVIGCIKLRGEAKAVDMYNFFDQQKTQNAELKAEILAIHQRMNEIMAQRPRERRSIRPMH